MWQLRFKFTQFIRSYRVSLCTRHAVDGEATRSSFQELTSGGGGGWRGERCIRKQIITRQCDNYDLVKLLQAIKRVCESFSARRRIILVSVAQMHLEGNLVELFWPLTQSPSGIQIDYSSHITENMLHGVGQVGERRGAHARVCGLVLRPVSPGSSFLNCSAVGFCKNWCGTRAMNWGAHRPIFNSTKPSQRLTFAQVWGTLCW